MAMASDQSKAFDSRRGLSRRRFLALTAATAGGAILAACGGSSSPTATTAATKAPTTGTTAAPTTAAATTAGTSPTTAPAATTSAASPAVAATSGTGASPAASPAASAATGAAFPGGGKFSTLEPVGKKGGRILMLTDIGEAESANPMLTNSTVSSNRHALLFNSLTANNPDNGLLFPDLALELPTKENGGISADGLTYTMKLRKDVKWHDGSPFTSKDVVFTYNTVLNKDLASPRYSETATRVAAISAPDDYTVVFKLKQVNAAFLSGMLYIVPESILGKVAVADIKTHPFSIGDPKATIGTGPWKLQEWVKDDHVTYAKHTAYFRGEPALDQLVVKVIKDNTVVTQQLKTGELDVGTITAPEFEAMGKEKTLNTYHYDAYSVTYIGFQLDETRSKLVLDKRVRQAMAYAIDRDSLIKAIRFGLATVAVGTEPTPSWAYAPDQIKLKYPYDPKKAEQLLDEAGWAKGADGIRAKDGQRMSFTLWVQAGATQNEQYATAIQKLWKTVGIEATPKSEERATFVSRYADKHDFDVILAGFGLDPDPDQYAFFATESYQGGFNRPKYSNPAVDKLLSAARTELDQTKRKQLYIDAQNILVEDLPYFFFEFPQSLVGQNKRVHNRFPNAVNTAWNSHTWWVDDGK
jgi:peptide/nickel transport system substrate-binding protein